MNCAVVGNVTTNGISRGLKFAYPEQAKDKRCAVNCAADVEIAEGVDCLLVTSAAFKDYANGDYTPAAGGALVDAGATPTGWDKLTDLAGKKRVVGSAIDIGAYELQAPSQPKGVLIIYR